MSIALCCDSHTLSSLSWQSLLWQIGRTNEVFCAHAASSHSDNRLAAVQVLFFNAALFMCLCGRRSQQVAEKLPGLSPSLKYELWITKWSVHLCPRYQLSADETFVSPYPKTCFVPDICLYDWIFTVWLTKTLCTNAQGTEVFNVMNFHSGCLFVRLSH